MALRQILDEHWIETQVPYDGDPCCALCEAHDGYYGTRWPCPTVRAVASIWAAHPGYREVWGDLPRSDDA
jgi:hypothetical protein